MYLLFLLFVPFAECLEGCEEISQETDVDSKADAHAREFEGNASENRECEEAENGRLRGGKYADDVFFLLWHNVRASCEGKKSDREDEGIQGKNADAVHGGIGLESCVMQWFSSQPFPGKPWEEDAEYSQECTAIEQALRQFHSRYFS